MHPNTTIDVLNTQCKELRRQLAEVTEDRNRWHSQAIELRKQARAWEKMQRASVEELRALTAEHLQRIAAIEREVLRMKQANLRREYLPCRKIVTGRS